MENIASVFRHLFWFFLQPQHLYRPWSILDIFASSISIGKNLKFSAVRMLLHSRSELSYISSQRVETTMVGVLAELEIRESNEGLRKTHSVAFFGCVESRYQS
jgi:hypothetical protein